MKHNSMIACGRVQGDKDEYQVELNLENGMHIRVALTLEKFACMLSGERVDCEMIRFRQHSEEEQS